MRTYPRLEALVGAVRELDRARANGGDEAAAVVRVELACLDLVVSTELVRRRDRIRAEAAVDRYLDLEKMAARGTP